MRPIPSRSGPGSSVLCSGEQFRVSVSVSMRASPCCRSTIGNEHITYIQWTVPVIAFRQTGNTDDVVSGKYGWALRWMRGSALCTKGDLCVSGVHFSSVSRLRRLRYSPSRDRACATICPTRPIALRRSRHHFEVNLGRESRQSTLRGERWPELGVVQLDVDICLTTATRISSPRRECRLSRYRRLRAVFFKLSGVRRTTYWILGRQPYLKRDSTQTLFFQA